MITVVILIKVELLGAVKGPRGYTWPAERVREYTRAVADKALNDLTRNRVFEGR